MNRRHFLGVIGVGLGGTAFGVSVAEWLTASSDRARATTSQAPPASPTDVIAAKFAYLSTHGNSSCSLEFKQSIASLPDDARLQGSCCAPMDASRYSAQIAGLT